MTETTELELQAPDSEKALIGAAGYYPDAIANTLERLPGGDFYDLVRGTVWDTIRKLSADHEPVTPVTVARRMVADQAWSQRAERIVQLEMSTASPASHADRHADIVADLAQRRLLLRAVNRARTTVTTHPDLTEVLTRVRAEFEDLDAPHPADPGPLGWDAMIAEFRAAHDPNTDTNLRIPTPWFDIDALLGGLFAGRQYVFGGRPGMGKALALDTPIPTPHGWTTMGSLRAGDVIMGADGLPTHVTQAHEVRTDRPCFEVEFSDGSVIVADAEHQWLTETRASRRSASESGFAARTSALSRDQRHKKTYPGVVTTAQIAATLRTDTADRRLNHSIPTCKPLDLSDADLLIPPYTLGVWLGDGTSAAAQYTSADPEIAAHIADEGFLAVKLSPHLRYALKLPEAPPVPLRTCASCGVTAALCQYCGSPTSGPRGCQPCWSLRGTVTACLRTIGVLGNKHIPAAYLRASEPQRRALLAGLLDTDGTVSPAGQVQFCVTSERLARHFAELAISLGYRVLVTTKQVPGRTETSSIAYGVNFTTSDDVFRLERKRILHKDRRQAVNDSRSRQRYITAVHPVPSVPVRCIEVDNADHLYLAGRSMIPTHNSTAALNIAMHAAAQHHPTLVISKEMPTVDVTGRVLSAAAGVPVGEINSRRLSERSRMKIEEYLEQAGRPTITVDAKPRSLTGIRSLARAHHHRHGLELLVVDYLQLVRVDTPGRNREQEVGEVSRQLKALAIELGVVVVLPAQLNRDLHKRADPVPTMADLRDSGQIEQDADVVTLLHRPPRNDPRDGEIDFIIDKNRHGPTGTITCHWRGGYATIADPRDAA